MFVKALMDSLFGLDPGIRVEKLWLDEGEVGMTLFVMHNGERISFLHSVPVGDQFRMAEKLADIPKRLEGLKLAYDKK
jgi:hypothetical protein